MARLRPFSATRTTSRIAPMNSGQQHWIGRASDAQKSAVKVAPEVLAKYVGVYKGIYLRNPRTVEVTFSGGTLSVSGNGGPKQPIRSRRLTFPAPD
jgi:hypothetical protein